MASTEDIEAKLAAYVDGDLGDADRAEIEAHLTTNPQHRQLIEELMQQRQLVRELPRQPAPADVAESINAQLERAVLLGDTDDQSEVVSMRIGRWAQIRAVAAVLVLTVGLAAAIYFLVPSNNKAPELADIRALPVPATPAAAPTERMSKMAAEPGGLGTHSDDLAAAKSAEPARTLAEGDRSVNGAVALNDSEQQRRAKDALANGGGGFGGGGGGKSGVASNAEPAGDKLFREVVNEQLNQAGKPSQLALAENKSLVVVIPTNDMDGTNRSVKRYLTDNGIKWEQQAEPMPAPLELAGDQRVLASRLQRSRVQMKGAPAAETNRKELETTAPATSSDRFQDVQQQAAAAPPTRQELQAVQEHDTGKVEQADATRQPAKQDEEKQQLPQQQQQVAMETPLAVQNTPDGQIQYVGEGQQLIVAKQVPRAQAIVICNDLNTGKLTYGYGIAPGNIDADAVMNMKSTGNMAVPGAAGGNIITTASTPPAASAVAAGEARSR